MGQTTDALLFWGAKLVEYPKILRPNTQYYGRLPDFESWVREQLALHERPKLFTGCVQATDFKVDIGYYDCSDDPKYYICLREYRTTAALYGREGAVRVKPFSSPDVAEALTLWAFIDTYKLGDYLIGGFEGIGWHLAAFTG